MRKRTRRPDGYADSLAVRLGHVEKPNLMVTRQLLYQLRNYARSPMRTARPGRKGSEHQDSQAAYPSGSRDTAAAILENGPSAAPPSISSTAWRSQQA